MKSNIAYKLYQKQLQIEEEQRKPFQKRPLIEPQIPEQVKMAYLRVNPYYSSDPAMSDMDKAQKIRLLKSVGINLSPGIDPDGVTASDYIKTHIQNLSNALETPLSTISDLVALYESPDEKQQELFQNITRSIKGLPDELIRRFDEAQKQEKLDKEDFGWGESKEESTVDPIEEAIIPLYYSEQQLRNLTTNELKEYGRTTLRMVKGSKGMGLSGTKMEILEKLIKRQRELQK